MTEYSHSLEHYVAISPDSCRVKLISALSLLSIDWETFENEGTQVWNNSVVVF